MGPDRAESSEGKDAQQNWYCKITQSCNPAAPSFDLKSVTAAVDQIKQDYPGGSCSSSVDTIEPFGPIYLYCSLWNACNS